MQESWSNSHKHTQHLIIIWSYLKSMPHVSTMGSHEHITSLRNYIINSSHQWSFLCKGLELVFQGEVLFVEEIRKFTSQWKKGVFSSQWNSSCPVDSCTFRSSQSLEQPKHTTKRSEIMSIIRILFVILWLILKTLYLATSKAFKGQRPASFLWW